MAVVLTRIRSVVTFCLAIIYLSNLHIKSNFIEDLTLVLLVIVLSLSFTVVTGSAKVIGYVSLALSVTTLLIMTLTLMKTVGLI